MEKLTYTLITGASRGIGWELSCRFAENQHNLILTARDEKKLKELASLLTKKHNIDVVYILCDLVDRKSVQVLFDQVRGNYEVDIFVNNAGAGMTGYFHKADINQALSMIQLNISSLTELTQLCANEMIKRGTGKIVNVASMGAFFPGPMMAVYYATKAYVLSFSLALASELKDKGVTVTTVCPGATSTDFTSLADTGESAVSRFISSPEKVSRKIYSAVMKGKSLKRTGSVIDSFITPFMRFLPTWLIVKITRLTNEKLHLKNSK